MSDIKFSEEALTINRRKVIKAKMPFYVRYLIKFRLAKDVKTANTITLWVSIAFIVISFFMLRTTFSEPEPMPIPVDIFERM